MELATAYVPQQVEDRLYQKWQESGVYVADPKSKKEPYSIVMPPPNVTGKLTLGHVLNNTIQDILARKARMEGREVLWLPGTDHAGLATQTAVERHIRHTEKKSRHDFVREEFIQRIWQWKHEFGGIITAQLRKLGASCDWSRERFTLDADYARAVQEVFVRLYDEKLIYRGTRMVNWCPGSLTAISDEEVIPTRQKGFLYHVKYELVEEHGKLADTLAQIAGAFGGLAPETAQELPTEDSASEVAASVVAGTGPVPGSRDFTAVRSTSLEPSPATTETARFLIVATTRPETIMADAALAVKPCGKWAHLVGRKVWRPLHREPIPIVADDAVEEGFGTGVLKVTPAHDKTDYEIGKRHNLDFRDILTPNGKINDPGDHDAVELNGLDRFEARKRSAELLRERGLLVKEEPYENTVGFSERAGVPIEPRLSEQWFLKYPNIKEALDLLRKEHVKFHPAHWTKVYEHWLENIQDWCISRQVWWGHRIPVWYKSSPSVILSGAAAKSKDQLPHGAHGKDSTAASAPEIRCQIESPGEGWTQDHDTLDTWFSSWLWAYETMRTDDGTRQKFYPTSALVTGPDIIFLWVARMLIAGLHFTPSGKPGLKANLAFRDVYFTGLIRDKQGRKLSKSLGNSPDPLDLIAKYGADGVRFGLIRIAPQGADIRFDEKQIEEGRNFCNKLWNVCRFRTLHGPIDPQVDITQSAVNPFCAKLITLLHERIGSVNQAINTFNFSEAASLLYSFVWDEFAARFVEVAKNDFITIDSPTRNGTLATFDYVLGYVLRLLHPFVPFVTEELWCELGFGLSIQLEIWPTEATRPPLHIDMVMKGSIGITARADLAVIRATEVYDTSDLGRSLRGELGLPSNQKIPFYLERTDLPPDIKVALATLLNASELFLEKPQNPGPKCFTPLGELYLPGSGLIDPALEIERLNKDLLKITKDLEQTRKKLGDTNMLAKAPPAKVEEWRKLETDLMAKEKSVRESLGPADGSNF